MQQCETRAAARPTPQNAMVLNELSPNIAPKLPAAAKSPAAKAAVAVLELAVATPFWSPPSSPATPTPATPALELATTEDCLLEHLSRHPKLARSIAGGGQATFLALFYLDSSVVSLCSWGVLATVVVASVASVVAPRASSPPQLSEFDLAPFVSLAVEWCAPHTASGANSQAQSKRFLSDRRV